MKPLTIFYDGGCPLCVKEMRHLRALDKARRIQFENINEADFRDRYPAINVEDANAYLHAQTADGEMLYGLDVTQAAWSQVGRGWMIAPLRWPIIKRIADKAYLAFAKHRNRLSKLLTGRERCEECRID